MVGIRGNKETAAKRYALKRSCVKWKITFEKVKTPSKIAQEESIKFVDWLGNQSMSTVCDFEECVTCTCMQSNDLNCMKENTESVNNFYVRKEERHGECRYEMIEEVNYEWHNVIADKNQTEALKCTMC